MCRFSLLPHFYSFSRVGGDERDRTDDPLLAKQVLYQLSYTPVVQPALTLSRCFPRLENYIATSQQTLETPFTPRNLNLRSVVVYSLERR